ncbi:hypothetical protein PPL_04672 [Heterostelium album PN500]|uniref:Uncharacterized protein n=1 Tax=Heterostelium pallidum (strain ATCC 26659 / Pp 5 / PN500) TaxID=670386 RepID=D3B881_HETP5|nr:hypothetical protein PPL_04672 [Heterostelium album PN500]EFA82249.1 hypothetical protein PPL_04672 [Heterostelium album PN500]|eukprot:XP_020434366.1 hypothetical protein PPL_04672 [Heterostelium album PN500]
MIEKKVRFALDLHIVNHTGGPPRSSCIQTAPLTPRPDHTAMTNDSQPDLINNSNSCVVVLIDCF